MLVDAVYGSPPWLLTAGCVALGLLFAFGCQTLVRRTISPETRGAHKDLVNFAVTNIAVLYAVLLAFLTVVSWESFSKASESASVEANLIGNLYHDSQGLSAPLAADLRGHVVRYLRTIIDTEWPLQAKGRMPKEGDASLVRLRRHVAGLSLSDRRDTVLMSDMLQVLNRLDNARAARLEALGGHVPPLIWTLIVVMGFLLTAVATLLEAKSAAMQAGLLGSFVLAIVLVLVMIVELDNPFRGSVSVPVDPYQHVLAQVLEDEGASPADSAGERR